MTQYTLASAPPDPLEGQYAGYWRRFLAAAIDLALYTPLYYGIQAATGEHALVRELVFAAIALPSYAWFFASRWQASPGMLLMGFHATDESGARMTFGQALKWGVVSSIGVIICCAGILYMQYRFDLTAVKQLMQSCQEENLRMEDCFNEAEGWLGVPYQTFTMMAGASVVMALFMLLIWSLSVGLARDKAGFHNLICHTRFVKGRVS